MQAYDLIMLVVLATAAIFGAIKGFAWQVASLASVVVSYLVAYNFRFEVAKMIHAAPPWNLFLAMLLLYVGSSFIIWVGFRLLSSAIDGVRLKEFDRHLGALFGLGKGLIFCLLITMFAMTLLGPKQQEAICKSKSGYYIAGILDKAGGILPKELHDTIGPYLANVDQKLHQQFPADGSAAANTGGGLMMPGWGSNSGGGLMPTGVGEQGGATGWNMNNIIPPSIQPQIPQTNPPQNFPPLTSPPGGFGINPNPGGSQQAQQPGLGWPR